MDPYAFLAADPRLYFAGAPSVMFPTGAAQILQEAYSRARRCGQRTLHHVPLGFGAIRRVERVSLPDGTTYSLHILLPGKRIHISRSRKKSPPRRHRKYSRNQPLVQPVWRKVYSVLPDKHLYFRIGLYVVMSVI